MFMFCFICYVFIICLPCFLFYIMLWWQFNLASGMDKVPLPYPVYKYNVTGCRNLSDIYFSLETKPTWLLLGNMIEASVDAGLTWDSGSCMWPSKDVTWFVKIPDSVLKIECTSKQIAGTISLHVAGDLLRTARTNKKSCQSGESHRLWCLCSIRTFGPLSQCCFCCICVFCVHTFHESGCVRLPRLAEC